MDLTDSLSRFKEARNQSYVPAKRVVQQRSSSDAGDESSQVSTPISGNTREQLEALHLTKIPKRKAPKDIYSQPANTGTGRHVSSKLYNILHFLKTCDAPQPINTVQSQTKVNLRDDKLLWSQLLENERIQYDATNETLAYKPLYQVRGKEDLVKLLQATKEGIEYKELEDSYSKLEEAVEELAKTGEILVIRLPDGSPRVLFGNNVAYNTPVDIELQKMWSEVKIPETMDLTRELKKAGLTTMGVFDKPVTTEVKTKKSSRGRRTKKILNTHIPGLDLTRDYMPPGK